MPDSPLKSLCMKHSGWSSSTFVSASHQTGLDMRSMTWRLIIVGLMGKGRSGSSLSLCPAGLCWTLAHLVQCGSDEGSRTWTQIWVQARMPDYSLNWTQRCQWCSSPIWRWLSRSQGPFGLNSTMEHGPSITDARQSTEKPLHKAVIERACQLFSVRDLQGSLNKFPDIFCMGTFIDSIHLKL